MTVVCDFCSDPNPKYTFPAKNIAAYVETEPNLFVQALDSVGAWLACEPCKVLVDTNQRDALTERACKAFGMSDVKSKKLVHDMHDAFFASRTKHTILHS